MGSLEWTLCRSSRHLASLFLGHLSAKWASSSGRDREAEARRTSQDVRVRFGMAARLVLFPSGSLARCTACCLPVMGRRFGMDDCAVVYGPGACMRSSSTAVSTVSWCTWWRRWGVRPVASAPARRSSPSPFSFPLALCLGSGPLRFCGKSRGDACPPPPTHPPK
jgi:hypothetical protein